MIICQRQLGADTDLHFSLRGCGKVVGPFPGVHVLDSQTPPVLAASDLGIIAVGTPVHVCVCTCVYVYVCMYVCVRVCECVRACACMWLCTWVKRVCTSYTPSHTFSIAN